MKGLSTVMSAMAALVLAACSLPVMDKQSDQVARTLYDEVRTGADLSGDPHLDASLRVPIAQQGFERIHSLLPPGAPTKVNNTGFNFNTQSGTGTVARLTHQYVYGDRQVTMQTFLRKPPGAADWTVVAVEANVGGGQMPIQVGTEPQISNGGTD